jgi:hypothetical protein
MSTLTAAWHLPQPGRTDRAWRLGVWSAVWSAVRPAVRPAVLLGLCLGLGSPQPSQAQAKLAHASLHLENNVTDDDYEIVIEVTGGDVGIGRLQVTAPDGRVVFDINTPNSKMGLRTFRLESPEPKSLAALALEFPAGAYSFNAFTVQGASLASSATLSHRLPPAARIQHPAPGAARVAPGALQLRWTAPPGLRACQVTVEHSASGAKVVQALLPGNARSYPVPARVLLANTEYTFSVGTWANDGNASFVETSFVTTKQ